MRVLIFGLSFASIFCAMMAMRQGPPASSSPLQVTPERVDLGRLRQNRQAVGRFELRNTGTTPIRIREVFGSCSCTSHELSSPDVPPGESVELSLTYDSGVSRGDTKTNATVYYVVEGERQLRFVTCPMNALVEPNIAWSPPRLQLNRETKTTAQITLRPEQIERFEVLDVSATHRAFSVNARAGRDPDQPCVIDVVFDPAVWGERSGESEVIVRTDDPVAPLLRIPVQVVSGNP